MYKKSEIRETLKSIQINKKNFEKDIIQKINKITENRVICAYISIYNEPNILDYINNPKTLCTTFIDSEKNIKISKLQKPLIRNSFGVLQPKKFIEIDEVDIFLIPGLAFDLTGTRLGRGGGIYDMLLSNYLNSLFIGVTFDEYIFNQLPKDDHDINMHALLTPTRFIELNI